MFVRTTNDVSSTRLFAAAAADGPKPRELLDIFSLMTALDRMPEFDLTGINVMSDGTVLVPRNADDTRSMSNICSY